MRQDLRAATCHLRFGAKFQDVHFNILCRSLQQHAAISRTEVTASESASRYTTLVGCVWKSQAGGSRHNAGHQSGMMFLANPKAVMKSLVECLQETSSGHLFGE